MVLTQLERLYKYSACDISDALLKLGCTHGGFLADIVQRTKRTEKTIAPASTVLFASKTATAAPSVADKSVEQNIKAGTPYADLTKTGTVVVLSQPAGQTCAVMGGIMAKRMEMLGAQGILVDGRIRDLPVLDEVKLSVWSRSVSTVGAGAESKPWACNVPVEIGKVLVEPGDIIFMDPNELSVVSIPKSKVDAVLEILPGLTAADERVMVDIEKGVSVADAFKAHR
ncbi:DlpA domain-containing protein [Pseudovirgaria hyperparasitica]|uniref:DlpA domain-containing protein n=1 Tax=Pseudovirgaria hyperparasitica TaxID=470096 RepID=A0A6A6VVU5_9PEZI|nr:DlpA domain-containing protein [Pseudovirgaria hyperparasitica]KAF2754702.1 DlpA domain-containing protein [Pseudovirgaria hyperparasitica]